MLPDSPHLNGARVCLDLGTVPDVLKNLDKFRPDRHLQEMSPLTSAVFQMYSEFLTKPARETRMSEAGGPRVPAGYGCGVTSPPSIACSSGVKAAHAARSSSLHARDDC